jgi:hypothetical protein
MDPFSPWDAVSSGKGWRRNWDIEDGSEYVEENSRGLPKWKMSLSVELLSAEMAL